MAESTSTAVEGMTPAQELMAKHAADEAHRPTVEEVVDEEDLEHPPPSASLSAAESTPTPAAQTSEKVAGKQKATDRPAKSNGVPVLNTQSEEAFPSLGAPKPRQPVAPMMWGKKPSSVANGVNGSANGTAAASNLSSRASTPASGRGAPTRSVNLPGQVSSTFEIFPQQMTPRPQLKKSLPETITEINKHSKAKIEQRPMTMDGKLRFEGKGTSLEAINTAFRELSQKVGLRQSIAVPVPNSVRASLIGRQGATIQKLQANSGARIQIPKQTENDAQGEDDDGEMIDVMIEGDPLAIQYARRDIESIVNERTSTLNMRLKDIPLEYYPYLAGAHNSGINTFEDGRDVRVKIPHYHTWVEQAPPQPPADGQQVTFAPQARDPIMLAGDRAAVQEVQREIERQVQELRQSLTLDQISVERGKHQFIVGDRGSSLHDFLEETGCTVVLPPSGTDSEILTVIGPADKLEGGMNKVMDLASSMAMTSVDIARQHAKAPRGAHVHARDLTRYLRHRQAIEQLERAHDASIVLPTLLDGPSSWEVFSRDGKNTMRARTDIMNLISGHPPARVSNVSINPFFHQYLQLQAAKSLRTDQGVYVVFPEQHEDSPDVVLVYEGLGSPAEYELPRRQPSPAEVQAFQRALQEAEQHLLGLISGQQEIVSRDVQASPKFHDKIRRYVSREQQGLPKDQIPVQLRYAGPSEATRGAAAGVFVRGPSDNVEEMIAKLLTFIEQEEKDELERSYTTSFEFPQKFNNFVIGKKGENIRKLREEFDVEIQVNDGSIELKGPEAKANACKAHINSLKKKLEDEATHILKIPAQYHRDLIGHRGAQVNRLQDRYSVRVNFPRTVQNDDNGDAATDAGSVKNYRQQPADEVIIKGPKRGADEAREELLNLLQYTKDNSFTGVVSVAQSQIPQLIGTGGREMDALRLATGAQIDVPGAKDIGSSGRAEVKLKGTKEQVEKAKKLLQERAKTFDETVTRTLDVDKKHHRTLIGSGGSNLRDIVIAAGGPEDRQLLARMVRFPRPESNDSTIKVEGPQAVVDKIIEALQSRVTDRENQVEETLEVAPEKHRLLIGHSGEARRTIQTKFNVTLDIPKQTATGAARSQVKITGAPENVASTKAHILEITKDQPGETVDIPRKYHNAISDNGQFFRRLRNDLRVTVDHNGEQPPPRPATTAGAPRARTNGGALPLITDDASADTHSWELVDASDSASQEEGTIPWILRGNADNLAKARAQLEKALQAAQKPNCTGYLILPDPKTYRFVIGPGGSQINAIRKETGTKVQVPRDQAQGEAIEIVGPKDGVEKAKNIILELVSKPGQGSGGSRRA
ncbi:hypothetical protein K402DRAFT_467116 [Aulographum hederae CBS 113979]|uniref:K Homology domain-containing protein n=1 Tax=Aulographum hederae CBS 113979 TaxID=1176131 RepID=A0A6G1GMB4_9PEZI|nr:hypothetical protein K402DRAFT_467116 [Aulographum hederae CBS 113979]